MLPVYLFDTNAVSDAMMNHPKIKAKMAGQPGQLITSVIVSGEIGYGLERLPAGKRRNDLKSKAVRVLAALPSEPVTLPTANLYATVRRAVELQGLTMDDNDLWIAATALNRGAVLVSRDKGFAQVPGLQVEDWTA